jgi:short-subunit dehydrogenase
MDKTVLITGASSGIGLAFAKLFAQKGYDLVLISQNIKKLDKVKSDILKENHNIRITVIPKDLSQPSSAEEIYHIIKDNSIKIDVLVNNAGVQIYGCFHDIEMEKTEQLMYLNMNTLVKMTRLFITDMINNGEGKILNVGSTGSFQPCPLNAVYCASKAFVLHFSEGIAEELKGTGITVTTLCPGATDTNFSTRGNMIGTKMFKGKLLGPNKVAQIGYKALFKGRRIAITGLSNKLTAFSVKFTPRFLVTKIGMNIMKKDI